jgi:predicted RNA-binding Zn-ribbon protein involved in translation (DUF1610 family)
MNGVNQDRSKRIVDALKSKGVNKPCPRCGHLHFGFVAESTIPISEPGVVWGGPVVPTVVVACNNCGFITQHALGALDIATEEPVSAG